MCGGRIGRLGTQDQHFRQGAAALTVGDQVTRQLTPHLVARRRPPRRPHFLERRLVVAHDAIDLTVWRLEAAQRQVDIDITRVGREHVEERLSGGGFRLLSRERLGELDSVRHVGGIEDGRAPQRR